MGKQELGRLSHYWKLSARSLRSVVRLTEDAVRDLVDNAPQVRFRGRKLSNEALVNAATFYVASLPKAQRAAIVAQAIARIEKLLESEGEWAPGNEPKAAKGAAVTWTPGGETRATPPAPKGKSSRRKSG